MKISTNRTRRGISSIHTLLAIALGAILLLALRSGGVEFFGDATGLADRIFTSESEALKRDIAGLGVPKRTQADSANSSTTNQQSSDPQQGTQSTDPPPGPADRELQEKLSEIETRYDRITAGARALGWDVAADNLEHFRSGDGEARNISPTWLKEQTPIQEAMDANLQRFASQLNSDGVNLTSLAEQLGDGETVSLQDYWDWQVGYSMIDRGRGLIGMGDELFYASGDSTLTTGGDFSLLRDGDRVLIEGQIRHQWKDRYDWHDGLAVWIPGEGKVSDSDALLLEEYRGAAPFDMRSEWAESIRGSYDLRTGEIIWERSSH